MEIQILYLNFYHVPLLNLLTMLSSFIGSFFKRRFYLSESKREKEKAQRERENQAPHRVERPAQGLIPGP